MFLTRVLLTLSLILHSIHAERYIETSSLLTCMADSQLTASYFSVKFYPSNSTVEFDVNAYTTISGNVVAKVTLITYGLNILNREISLCDLGMDELCPLSTGAGRIDVSSNYALSDSVTKLIPGIAYTIPDLDARVRVLAYSENDTDTPLACVEAILTNGKTVQTKYASWPIAAISGLGLLTSGVISIIGHSNTAAHIASNSISLFVYFQNLSITSMMAVARVPPIAAAWCQNFVWSMGIIKADFMQDAIKWYVQATGGTSTVVIENDDILSISVQKRSLIEGLKSIGPLISEGLVKRDSDFNFDDDLDDTDLYTTDEHDTDDLTSKILVLRGIQRVSYLAKIEISNFFLTGIVFFLFFLFVLLVCIISFKGFAEILVRSQTMKEHKFQEFRAHWSTIIKGTLFRLALIAFPQISLLSLWELTERDSAAIVVVAVFLLLIICGLLSFGAFRVIERGRKSQSEYKTPAYLLYGDTKFLNRFGFLYVQFQADFYWWLIPVLAYTILRSIFVGLVQSQGKAQAMCVFLIELAYFIALCCIRPYMDKRTNIFNMAIHGVNWFNSLLFLFFSNIFGQPAVVASVCAVVLFVVNAAFALFLLIFTIVTCALAVIYKNPDTRYQKMKDDRVCFISRTGGMEKSNKKDTELLALGETVLSSNHMNNSLESNQLQGETSSEDSDRFPQSRIGETARFSRSDSLTSDKQVVPASTIIGTESSLKKPGLSFSDTTYHGPSNSSFYKNDNSTGFSNFTNTSSTNLNSSFNSNNSNYNSNFSTNNTGFENPYAKARNNRL